ASALATRGTPATDQPKAVSLQPSEPAALRLPFDPLTAEIKVGRAYLRQIAITNLESKAQIQRGEIAVKPLQLTLNGAPVSGAGRGGDANRGRARLHLGCPVAGGPSSDRAVIQQLDDERARHLQRRFDRSCPV